MLPLAEVGMGDRKANKLAPACLCACVCLSVFVIFRPALLSFAYPSSDCGLAVMPLIRHDNIFPFVPRSCERFAVLEYCLRVLVCFHPDSWCVLGYTCARMSPGVHTCVGVCPTWVSSRGCIPIPVCFACASIRENSRFFFYIPPEKQRCSPSPLVSLRYTSICRKR